MSGHDERHEHVGEEQHQRLCAFVFGELGEAEAAAFEEELEGSPALRAEHLRLLRTIEVVQDALPSESLSVGAAEAVFAAAESGAGEVRAVDEPPPADAGEPADPAVPTVDGALPPAGGAASAATSRAGDAGAAGAARRPRFAFLRGGGAWRAAAAALLLLGAGALYLGFLRGGAVEGPVSYAPFTYRIGGASGEVARRDEQQAASRAPGHAETAPAAPLAKEEARQARTLSNGSRAKATETAGEAEAAQLAAAPTPEAKGGAAAPQPSQDTALEGLGYVSGGAGAAPSAAEPQASPSTDEAIGIGAGVGGKFGLRASARTRQPGPPAIDLPAAEGAYASSETALPWFEEPVLEAIGGEERERLDALGYAHEDAEEDSATGSEGFFVGRGGPARPAAGDRRRPVEPAPRWSQEELDRRCVEIFRRCRIQPRETPSAMFFRCWGDNPFELTALDRLSTFSVDVDTASYTLARRYLHDGFLPKKAQVRTEEFVNYFDADTPPPAPGETFALGLELAPSPFGSGPDAWMLRVAVRGEDVDAAERQPLSLTFVVDVSGSMAGERLALVRQALGLLARQLSTTDSVALVSFDTEARVVLQTISAASRGAFDDAVAGLSARNSTNVQAGLRLGYELASSALTPGAVNRVVLLSDGVGNVGETDQRALLAEVERYRDEGIYLNAVGVGMGNHDDEFMEQLADRGDGLCHYVDSLAEARRVFVDELVQTLQPIARDVKIQVEFDPEQVERYRLLGYENRAVADAAFRDDAVDAGEVNAGHQVVALYELVARPAGEAPLATARLRWKPPFAIDAGETGAAARAGAEQAREIERSIGVASARTRVSSASPGFRRDVLVAQFAEVLRRSVHARGDSYDRLLEGAEALRPELGDPDFDEFVELLSRARPFVEERARFEDDALLRAIDELCRLHYLEGQRELLVEPASELEEARNEPGGLEEDLEATIRRMEELIRELLRQRHAAGPAVDGKTLEQLKALGYGDDR